MRRIRNDRTGVRYGKLLAIEPCGQKPNNDTIWRCLCDCGNETQSTGSDLTAGQAMSCGRGGCHPRAGTSGERSPRWLGVEISYAGAHHRVVRLRGPARNHSCVDCGSPAQDWSYDGRDPEERLGLQRGKRTVPQAYSPDPAFYVARCRSCHKVHDLGQVAR